jgi:hypothetical protein
VKARLYQHMGQLKGALAWLKKTLAWPTEATRGLIAPAPPRIRMARQGQLVGRPRARWDDQPTGVSWENLQRLRWLAEPYTRPPVDGVRRRTAGRKCQGYGVKVPRGARLMRVWQRRGCRAVWTGGNGPWIP